MNKIKLISLTFFLMVFTINICSAQLHGIYTIGKNGTENFSSFTKAINAISNQGTTNVVIFRVSPGIYEEQLLVPFILGSESYTPVYFQSADSNSNSVVIKYKPTVDSMNYTIRFSETNHVFFQWLTFSTDTISGRIAQIDRYCKELRFENCVFKGMKGGAELVVAPCQEGYYNEYLMFTNNTFIEGSDAISLCGETTYPDENTYIKGNTFTNQSKTSIFLKYHATPTIISNIFLNNTNGQGIAGIKTESCNGNMNISRNQISFSKVGLNTFGIRLFKSSGTLGGEVLIANNFIYANTDEWFSGIDLTNCNYINIIYNSIHVAGDATGSTAINFILGSNTILRNNILANNANGFAIISSSNTNLVTDHNNLYTSGNVLVYYESNALADLDSWTGAIGQETGSVSVSPGFCSDSNLHTFNTLLNNAGISVGTIKTDFDGESRGVNPDIGADEFTPVTFSLGNDQETCVGQELKIIAANGFEKYFWYNGSTNKDLTLKSGINKDSLTDVWVRVSKKGCYFYDTIKVNFHSFPEFTLGNDTIICENFFDSLLLFGPSGFKSYLWQDASYTSFYVVRKPSSVPSKKLYWLKITNEFGCFNIDSMEINFVICGAVNSELNDQTLILYPNPAESFINILPANSEHQLIEIFNSSGEMVLKQEILANPILVDVSHLKSGIYFIKIAGDKIIRKGVFNKQ